MIDVKPSTVFGPGFTADDATHKISFNTNDASADKTLTQLLDTQADPDSGDARQILLAIAEKAYGWYVALATGTKPKKLIVQRSTITGRDGTVTNVYTFRFIVTPPTGNYEIPAES